ncbi:xylose transport system permease XylH [Escherichia coli]|uniref:Xylose transport system permease XylH n=1 Tax=Escherichia coli TaxID=562 RepID=A0A376V9Y6_ECOLX|nr:xylose transport system permease XylH [Escherichia coli]
MSKSNPSEVKLAVPTSGGFSGLKSLNLQVFVMIAAIIAIMLFFTWTTDGAYLSARNVSNLLRPDSDYRHPRSRNGVRHNFC